MKGVQCYELFGGIALKNRTFFRNLCSFSNPTTTTTNSNYNGIDHDDGHDPNIHRCIH